MQFFSVRNEGLNCVNFNKFEYYDIVNGHFGYYF